MREPGKEPGVWAHPNRLAHDFFKIRRHGGKLSTSEDRAASFPNRRRVLIIEDDVSTRTMLYAYLTSMRCECVATARREALAALRRKDFDAVLVNFGPSSDSAKQFLLKMQKVRPDLMGKTIVITAGASDAPATKVVESYALPRVPENLLFQDLWSNLQNLFSTSGFKRLGSPPGRGPRLVIDASRHSSPRGMRTGPNAARHLVYTCDDLFVDLLIGHLPRTGRVEVVGQVLGNPVGKINLANLPVVLLNSNGPIAYANTNQLGEFCMEFSPENDLAVRIFVGPNSWVDAPLRNMDWARK
jgi:CheY-like chemotaxis protein